MHSSVQKIMFAALAVLTVAGCVFSEPGYTPYTLQGSSLMQGKGEFASVLLSYEDFKTNRSAFPCMGNAKYDPVYTVELRFQDSPRTKIKLGCIFAGRRSSVNASTRQIVVSRADGMTIDTDDVLLRNLLDHMSVVLTQTSSEKFAFTLTLLDEEERTLGVYRANFPAAAFFNWLDTH